MTRFRNRRLRAALLVLAIYGGAFAAANAVGQGWGASVTVTAFLIAVMAVIYVRAGRDSDYAALSIGGQPDERQTLIRRRARALSGATMAAAAVIGAIVVIALRGPGHWESYWPFGLALFVGTVSYAWGGRACGFSALIGGRADERQTLIRTRAAGLSGRAMVIAVLISMLVEIALKDTLHSYWPFALLACTGTLGYDAGLRRYGAHGEGYTGPGDDAEQRAPAPSRY